MDHQLHILQHALGLNAHGEGRPHRRHFVAGPGSDDHGACVELAAKGFMSIRGASDLTGGDTCFMVTQAGMDFVASNSPPRPKVSRSKQRYLNFLRADCGMGFGEWLRAR